jgi:hypothetical protein
MPRSAAAAVKLPYVATEFTARMCLIPTSNARVEACRARAIIHSNPASIKLIGKQLIFISGRSTIIP